MYLTTAAPSPSRAPDKRRRRGKLARMRPLGTVRPDVVGTLPLGGLVVGVSALPVSLSDP